MCGDVTMAGDVLKTIQQIIKQQGQMSIEDAGFYISKLRVRSYCAIYCNGLSLEMLNCTAVVFSISSVCE